jgi:hypothetical protein
MRVVAALGGNALLERGEKPDADIQESHIQQAAEALVPLARAHDLNRRVDERVNRFRLHQERRHWKSLAGGLGMAVLVPVLFFVARANQAPHEMQAPEVLFHLLGRPLGISGAQAGH